MILYLSNMLLFFMMLIPHCTLVRGIYNRYEIQEDIRKFNMMCIEDSCKHRIFDRLSSYNCHCGIGCVKFGSCCPDTPFAGFSQPKFKPPCRSANDDNYYFMVDRCFSPHRKWADLCNTEWDGLDDLQSVTPVTSRSTYVTYKNYYCFRCHESTNNFLYWNAYFKNDLKSSSYGTPSSLTYDKENGTWVVDYKEDRPPTSFIYDKEIGKWMVQYEDISPFPVTVSFFYPNEIKNSVYDCIPGVISDCSAEWSDENVRNKCQSYMTLRIVYRNNSLLTYKNIHCALCNFESLNDIMCISRKKYPQPVSGFAFSFTYLLDINRSDGELVGKIQRCAEDHLWDPFTKKCRQLSCALPGSKLQNGKCVNK